MKSWTWLTTHTLFTQIVSLLGLSKSQKDSCHGRVKVYRVSFIERKLISNKTPIFVDTKLTHIPRKMYTCTTWSNDLIFTDLSILIQLRNMINLIEDEIYRFSLFFPKLLGHYDNMLLHDSPLTILSIIFFPAKLFFICHW